VIPYLQKRFIYILFGCKEVPSPKAVPPPSAFTQLMQVDMLHALPEFGPHPCGLENIFSPFEVVAKRRHYQQTGPPPNTFSHLMNVDMLHGLLELLRVGRLHVLPDFERSFTFAKEISSIKTLPNNKFQRKKNPLAVHRNVFFCCCL
jgi:hypothetical protein